MPTASGSATPLGHEVYNPPNLGSGTNGGGRSDVDISDQIAAVYQWDEGAQTWLVFIPGLRDLPGLNTLTTFRTGGDYWIFATGPVAWTVTLASSRRSQDRLP